MAVATDDTIYIFIPEYPRGGGPDDAGEDEELQSQFSLSYRASGLIRPDPTINAQLCSFSGIRVAGPPANDENWFPGVGNGLVTGSGASICQIVRLEWSPNGLGCNLRPILTALSTNGGVYALGEHIDMQSTMVAGMRTRSFKAWKTLWGLGAQLPLPDASVEDGYRNMNERIQSFSWAKELAPGRALLAYCNDVEEVAIMSVQLFPRPREGEPSIDETVWDIREVGRFDGRGKHTKEDVSCSERALWGRVSHAIGHGYHGPRLCPSRECLLPGLEPLVLGRRQAGGDPGVSCKELRRVPKNLDCRRLGKGSEPTG